MEEEPLECVKEYLDFTMCLHGSLRNLKQQEREDMEGKLLPTEK